MTKKPQNLNLGLLRVSKSFSKKPQKPRFIRSNFPSPVSDNFKHQNETERDHNDKPNLLCQHKIKMEINNKSTELSRILNKYQRNCRLTIRGFRGFYPPPKSGHKIGCNGVHYSFFSFETSPEPTLYVLYKDFSTWPK